MPSYLNLLKLITGKPMSVAADSLPQPGKQPTADDIRQLSRHGLTGNSLSELLMAATQVNFERRGLYGETEEAKGHPLVGAAVELYVDFATAFSRINNATIWPESPDPVYRRELEKLFERVNIEENIAGWANDVVQYGDLFARINGESGVGVFSLDDSYNPEGVSRMDFNGRLLGFVETPDGVVGKDEEHPLLAPWEFVHFRALGARRRRRRKGNSAFNEFSIIGLHAPDCKRITTRYGTSTLLNALPIYKRLKLTEDSIAMARLSKGLLRYIYKLKVSGTNMEAIDAQLSAVAELLKRSKALNVDPNNPSFDDRLEELAANQDVVLPVWEDINNLSWEKLGGETDIHWIKDQEEQKRQLAAALRTPLSLLGDTADLPGTIGQSAIDRLSINFARQARRIQRSLISGVTRVSQVHLAYKGYNPDPSRFTVCMSETSTAEEEELKDALKSGMEVAERLYDLLVKAFGDKAVKKQQTFEYINGKLLKLNDLKVSELVDLAMLAAENGQLTDERPGSRRTNSSPSRPPSLPAPHEEPVELEPEKEEAPPEGELPTAGGELELVNPETPPEMMNASFSRQKRFLALLDSDCRSLLPSSPSQRLWEARCGTIKVVSEVEAS